MSPESRCGGVASGWTCTGRWRRWHRAGIAPSASQLAPHRPRPVQVSAFVRLSWRWLLWLAPCGSAANYAQPLSPSALVAADLCVRVALRRDEEAVASGLLGVGPHVLAHDSGKRLHLLALLIVHHDDHARGPAGWTPRAPTAATRVENIRGEVLARNIRGPLYRHGRASRAVAGSRPPGRQT